MLWNAGDFGGVHDWLGLRWNKLVQIAFTRGDDKDARFLQGLAFAALAFHFTQNRNQDGARLLADDALCGAAGIWACASWRGDWLCPQEFDGRYGLMLDES